MDSDSKIYFTLEGNSHTLSRSECNRDEGDESVETHVHCGEGWQFRQLSWRQRICEGVE